MDCSFGVFFLSYQQQPGFPPPPYSPPQVDYRQWGAAPVGNPMGRAAAICQIVLAALLFFPGTCVGAAIWALPDSELMRAMEQQQTNFPPLPNMTMIQEIRLIMTVVAVILIVPGLILFAFSPFVFRGGKASTICSAILTGLVGCILALNFVTGLIQALAHPANLISVALILAMLVLAGVTLWRQIVSLKAGGAAQMQAMQQAYYWMMQQQQMAAQQAGQNSGQNAGQNAGQNFGGYGYGQNVPTPQYQQPNQQQQPYQQQQQPYPQQPYGGGPVQQPATPPPPPNLPSPPTDQG
jgi:hypothetical protein